MNVSNDEVMPLGLFVDTWRSGKGNKEKQALCQANNIWWKAVYTLYWKTFQKAQTEKVQNYIPHSIALMISDLPGYNLTSYY